MMDIGYIRMGMDYGIIHIWNTDVSVQNHGFDKVIVWFNNDYLLPNYYANISIIGVDEL